MTLPKVTDDLPVAKSNRYFSVSIFLGLFIIGAFVPFEHSFLLHMISPPFFPSTIPASTATSLDSSCPLLFCSLLEFWCPVGSCLSVCPWNCVHSLDLITPTSTLNQDLFLLWSDICTQPHIGQIHKMCYSFIHSSVYWAFCVRHSSMLGPGGQSSCHQEARTLEWIQHLLHVISASQLGLWKSLHSLFFFNISSKCLSVTYPARSSQRGPSPPGTAVFPCGLSSNPQDTRVNCGCWPSTGEEKMDLSQILYHWHQMPLPQVLRAILSHSAHPIV